MGEKTNPLREVDDEAFDIAGRLLSATKYGSLGVIDPDSQYPIVSRVAACWSDATGVFFAASDLSLHSKGLASDTRCSLMLGEPGKGDGLAYPRVTILATTKRMPNDHPERSRFREIFLRTHPKAELYIDFADFGFYPMVSSSALLNGGFGKAYHLEKEDLECLNA